jgi:predicted dienelactone hydrolase
MTSIGQNLPAAATGSPTKLGPQPPPKETGPYTVESTSATASRYRRDTPYVVHMPKAPVGSNPNFPVVLFLPGFMIGSKAYEATAKHLASHGFVVVQAEPQANMLNADHLAMAEDASGVLDDVLEKFKTDPRVNKSKVGVTGHSLGGKIATVVAVRDSRVKSILTLDPVFANPPIHTQKAEADGKNALAALNTPKVLERLKGSMGVIGQTLDVAGWLKAVTPAESNFKNLFETAKSVAMTEWTVPGANHFSFVDADNAFGNQMCQKATAEKRKVIEFTRATMTAFFRKSLKGDLDMAPYLEQKAAAPELRVEVRKRS